MLQLPKIDESPELNGVSVLYWNHVGLEMNRITHSLGGPHTGPTMSSRALGLLQLAMHDAYFGALGHGAASNPPPYLPDHDPVDPGDLAALPLRDPIWTHGEAERALTAAAITVLDTLYKRGGPGISVLANKTLASSLAAMVEAYDGDIDVLGGPYRYGEEVAERILGLLAVQGSQRGADAGRYRPKDGPLYFRDEPLNPVRRQEIDPDHPERGTRPVRIYHAPFYGEEVAPFAVTDPDAHTLSPWPTDDYVDALREVVRLGGAPGLSKTARKPDQTVAAYYWAYDGANLIGTPPRLYNQIIRKIAWEKKTGTPEQQYADFVRILALVNVAMADAGKFAWKEKYRFELWRPLSGVREHDRVDLDVVTPASSGPSATAGREHLVDDADPFWAALGAPETNTDKISFKPPFPAYPSGHATFGAACFQMARHFFSQREGLNLDPAKADTIAFDFVSEELNGVSRDLHRPYHPELPLTDQPGDIRTRIVRRFPSLWAAIFENALSRIYLGVHWRFDAFDAKDGLKPNGQDYKKPDEITYSSVWPRQPGVAPPIGGVPLGLGIANDIWANRMRMPGAAAAPVADDQAALTRRLQELKSSNTNVR
jgi:vanadium chloroperoxidase